MKKQLILLTLLQLLAFTSYSQCSMELYHTKRFISLMEDFKVAKTYRVDGRGGARKKVQYTAVFNKSTAYRIVLVSKDGRGEGIVATIHDAKKRPLYTTLVGNEHKDFIDFDVTTTGIYYITFTFEHSKSFCGFGILGFRND